jgi:hypothetical protein
VLVFPLPARRAARHRRLSGIPSSARSCRGPGFSACLAGAGRCSSAIAIWSAVPIFDPFVIVVVSNALEPARYLVGVPHPAARSAPPTAALTPALPPAGLLLIEGAAHPRAVLVVATLNVFYRDVSTVVGCAHPPLLFSRRSSTAAPRPRRAKSCSR